jgi:hypothetical protein
MSEQHPDTTQVDPDRSVTCPICGELADERETVSLWEDDYEPNPTSNHMVVAMFPNGEAHAECFSRVASEPMLVPEEALETLMEFLKLDEHLLSHINADDDLAAAIVAINRSRGESWDNQPWTDEWAD